MLTVGASGQSPQRRATSEKREQILKAALDVFGNHGYTNGTLADIAEQVGITHAGVLHHFGSKQKLLLEVLEYRDQSGVSDLIERHMPGGADTFVHLVQTAFANAQRPGIVQVYTVLSADSVTDSHPARPFFQGRYSGLRALIVDAFEELCEQEGVTDRERVREASAGIIAVMDGLQLQWLLHPDEFDLGEATGFAIRSLVNGVLHPGPELETYSDR